MGLNIKSRSEQVRAPKKKTCIRACFPLVTYHESLGGVVDGQPAISQTGQDVLIPLEPEGRKVHK